MTTFADCDVWIEIASPLCYRLFRGENYGTSPRGRATARAAAWLPRACAAPRRRRSRRLDRATVAAACARSAAPTPLTARARRLIDTDFDRLAEGLSHYLGVFSVVPPQASAMSFVRYNLPVGSRDLAMRVGIPNQVRESRVLVLRGWGAPLDEGRRVILIRGRDHHRRRYRHCHRRPSHRRRWPRAPPTPAPPSPDDG